MSLRNKCDRRYITDQSQQTLQLIIDPFACDVTSSKEDLSLVERCARRIRTCSFPVFDLIGGDLCRGSVRLLDFLSTGSSDSFFVSGNIEERILLNQQSWLLKAVATEIRLTAINRQRSHLQRLLRLLLEDSPSVLFEGK